MKEKTDHGGQRLKYILGKEAEEEATEQQQQYDNEQCDIVSKMKLVYKEIHIKEFRVTRNLNGINTRIIMVNRTPHIEMGTKVINSFKSEVHRIASKILDQIETLILPPVSWPVQRRLNYISRNINKVVGFGEYRSIAKGLFTRYENKSGFELPRQSGI